MQPRAARGLMPPGYAVRGGREGRRRGAIVVSDDHVNAALAEPGESVLYPGEASRGARGDGHLEARPSPRPHRALGDRLGGVRREPPRPLEGAARLAHGGRDAHPYARRRLRCARLRLAGRADEESGGMDEIPVGPYAIEDALRYHDREIRLQGQRQLDEIERIGG